MPSAPCRRGVSEERHPHAGMAPWVRAAAIAVLGLASLGAQGGALTSEAVATFTESNAGYLGNAGSVEYTIFSDGNSDSIGAVVGGVGAKASGSVSAAIKGTAEAFWYPSYDFTYSSLNKVNVAWVGDLSVGESFFVSTSADPLGWGKVHLQDPGFQGSIGLSEDFRASANAKGCLGGCLNLDLSLKLSSSRRSLRSSAITATWICSCSARRWRMRCRTRTRPPTTC